MNPDMIRLLNKHIGVGMTIYDLPLNRETVPLIYKSWFDSSPRQSFVISRTNAVEFVDKVGAGLQERGVIFDL